MMLDIWDLDTKQNKLKIHNENEKGSVLNGDVCTDYTLYSEGWVYLFTCDVFTHYDEMT